MATYGWEQIGSRQLVDLCLLTIRRRRYLIKALRSRYECSDAYVETQKRASDA
jgi:hypothetical protein